MDRALASGAKGRGFESLLARHIIHSVKRIDVFAPGLGILGEISSMRIRGLLAAQPTQL